jgi:hypothetical protein
MLAKKSFSADSSLSESLSEAEPQKFTLNLVESASAYSNNSQLHSDTLNEESIDVKSHSSLLLGLG